VDIGYFTEQPMSLVPQDETAGAHEFDHPARAAGDSGLLFSNRFFDPVDGSRLLNERLVEYRYVEECGFDSIYLNEHHNESFCMQCRISITAAILATQTERVRIIFTGYPLPLGDNPTHVAEEISLIDMYSRGRVVFGIVRGAGGEQISSGQNPAYNRERFLEAHDLIIKSWTTPGPFRWEGRHYQFRVVNPWVLPMQKPHPHLVVPGTLSPETIRWAAERRYPYVSIPSTLESTRGVFALYDQYAEELGYTAGPEHRGFHVRCAVAPTHEKAMAKAEQFYWMRGTPLRSGLWHPHWGSPPGYTAPRARIERARWLRELGDSTLADEIDSIAIVVGTPETVVEKLSMMCEELRPGFVGLWANDGTVDHADSMESISLLGEHVVPALRKLGSRLQLFASWERPEGNRLPKAASAG